MKQKIELSLFVISLILVFATATAWAEKMIISAKSYSGTDYFSTLSTIEVDGGCDSIALGFHVGNWNQPDPEHLFVGFNDDKEFGGSGILRESFNYGTIEESGMTLVGPAFVVDDDFGTLHLCISYEHRRKVMLTLAQKDTNAASALESAISNSLMTKNNKRQYYF